MSPPIHCALLKFNEIYYVVSFTPIKKRYTLATRNDIEYHLYFNVSKVYLAYLLRKDQKYTFRTILSFITYPF